MSLPYVALGDSYAAGVGGGPRRNPCWRSDDGYPVLVARSLELDLAYQACIGATVANVERDQLGALGAQTTHVSLTVGGNDIGFVPVLLECAKPAWMGDSDPAIDRALTAMRTELPDLLAGLLARIRDGAPNARLVVTAYPVLFNGQDCNALTFFSPHEMRRIGEGADELAGVIAAAAEGADAGVVDPRAAFEGHAICDDGEWLNGVAWPIEGSFHPNAAGHAAYAVQVARAFGVVPGAVPEREVKVVQGPERRGDAPTFALPDLLSVQSLEGARRVGINPADIVRLVQEERFDELQRLDREVRESLRGADATPE